jgi:hypothetical protein
MILLCNHKHTVYEKPYAYREPMCASENCEWNANTNWKTITHTIVALLLGICLPSRWVAMISSTSPSPTTTTAGHALPWKHITLFSL